MTDIVCSIGEACFWFGTSEDLKNTLLIIFILVGVPCFIWNSHKNKNIAVENFKKLFEKQSDILTNNTGQMEKISDFYIRGLGSMRQSTSENHALLLDIRNVKHTLESMGKNLIEHLNQDRTEKNMYSKIEYIQSLDNKPFVFLNNAIKLIGTDLHSENAFLYDLRFDALLIFLKSLENKAELNENEQSLYAQAVKYLITHNEKSIDIEINFSGFKFLLYADLTSKKLNNSNFSNADLTGVDFQKTELRHVNFEKANLRKVNFSYVDAEHACFKDANLREVKCNRMYSTRLKYANFENTDLRDADFSSVQAELACFTNAKIEKAIFRGINLKYATITKAQLSTVLNLYGSSLTGLVGQRKFKADNSILFERPKRQKQSVA